MRLSIDRTLPVSLRHQIRAAIVDAIASGALPSGTSLPSVRDLADRLDCAPMTITKVYAELKGAGLVAARTGSGTYVTDSTLARFAGRGGLGALRALMDGLIDHAEAAGIAPTDILSLMTRRVVDRHLAAPRKRIVMAGLFPEATGHYARCVAEQLGELGLVEPVALGPDTGSALDEGRASALRAADLVLTFADLQHRVAALAPDARVIALRFIPAEATRLALAAIDPLARVVVVSRFADFLPVLTLGVRRFAAHVRSVGAFDIEAPALAAELRACDVVVISTGAEAAAALAPPEAGRIEYLHIPDPADVDRLVVPLVTPADADPAIASRKEAS